MFEKTYKKYYSTLLGKGIIGRYKRDERENLKQVKHLSIEKQFKFKLFDKML